MEARCLGNARGGEVNSLYRRSCLVEGVTAVHGMGTARRWRGAMANSSAGAARCTYDDVAVGWSARRAGRMAHGKRTRMAVRQGRRRRMDQRSEVGLSVRAQQGRGAAGARRQRDGALWTPKAENQSD
jgi:hypothetical protein